VIQFDVVVKTMVWGGVMRGIIQMRGGIGMLLCTAGKGGPGSNILLIAEGREGRMEGRSGK